MKCEICDAFTTTPPSRLIGNVPVELCCKHLRDFHAYIHTTQMYILLGDVESLTKALEVRMASCRDEILLNTMQRMLCEYYNMQEKQKRSLSRTATQWVDDMKAQHLRDTAKLTVAKGEGAPDDGYTKQEGSLPGARDPANG